MIEIIFLIFFILCCLGIYLKERNINKQKQEIKKYKNITEYIIANKDNIILTRIDKTLICFELDYIHIEMLLGSKSRKIFIIINDIDFGYNTRLSKILKEIYYKDREKFLF